MPLRAMILLGINGGLGNTDIGELRESAIEGEWLVYPRVKTHADRRIPLWPETLLAIHEAIESRPVAKIRLMSTAHFSRSLDAAGAV